MDNEVIIVANRLIYSLDEHGKRKLANGGLATGIASYIEKTGQNTHFIGWPGKDIPSAEQEKTTKAYQKHGLTPVFYDELEATLFYEEYCNRILWQVAHLTATEDSKPVAEIIADVQKDGDYAWQKYVEINQRFADAIIKDIAESGKDPAEITIWIQDYHLMLVPQMLREKLPELKIGYFHHIPIPLAEHFNLVPEYQRRVILEGLMGADQIAFHTNGYRRNFTNILKEHGFPVTPNDEIAATSTNNNSEQRAVNISTIPIGINYEKYAAVADDETVKKYIDKEQVKSYILTTLLETLTEELKNEKRELTKQFFSLLNEKAGELARSISADITNQQKTVKLIRDTDQNSETIKLTKQQLALISNYAPKFTMSLLAQNKRAKSPDDLFADNNKEATFNLNKQQIEMLLRLRERLNANLSNINQETIAKQRKLVKLLTKIAKTDTAGQKPQEFSEKDWKLMQELLPDIIKKHHDHVSSKTKHLESFYNFVKENNRAEKPKQVFLSVDRMDISKNIPEKLEAILKLLEMHPELADQIHFEFICVPSREGVKEYQKLGQQVRALETEINNKHPGILQVHYCDYASYPGLVQWFYKNANALIAVPKIDGFNLVIPEAYAAHAIDPNFMAIISDTIGVAQYLPDELVAKVSKPNNIELIAEKYYEVFNMSPEEKSKMTKPLQEKIKQEISIFRWAENNLKGINKAAQNKFSSALTENASLTRCLPLPPYDRGIDGKLEKYKAGNMTPRNEHGGWGGGGSGKNSADSTPGENITPLRLPESAKSSEQHTPKESPPGTNSSAKIKSQGAAFQGFFAQQQCPAEEGAPSSSAQPTP